ncbi:MAG: hypothetical protein RML40_08765 [Bacteroidota bacterium]|nr:hypothetical protein [Candidatus Kapabacteria bacterium]MDW8220608.1 hypothetical protein [Bacteroidota bacterium]
MYEIVLVLHSLLRWIVILAALVALYRAYLGWFAKQAWSASDRRWNMMFAHSMTAQFILGVLLYVFLSPITTQGVFQNFGVVMKDRIMRFWGIEHTITMLLSVALAHIGNARAAKAASDNDKHKSAALMFTLALLLILVSIPWPFLVYGRPLFRFF